MTRSLCVLLFAAMLAPAGASAAVRDPVPLLFDPETQAEGAALLNKMSARKADRLVLQTLKRTANDAEGRRILLAALADAGKAGGRILARVAGSKDVALAQDAYKELERVGSLGRVRGDMIKRVKSGRPLSLALFSVDQLVRMRDKQIEGVLKQIVESRKQPTELRVASVHGLGRLGGPDIIRHLTLVYQRSKHGVGPSSIEIRRSLLESLAAHGKHDDVIPTLIDALRVPELWNTGVESLVSLGRRAVPSMRLVLETGDREVEPGVLAVLFRLGGIDVSRFIKMLSSTDDATRRKARWLLLAFPDARIVPELVKLWDRNKGYPTRGELMDLLIPYYDSEEVRTIFQEALRLPEQELRVRALDVITGMRDRSLGDQVLSVAEDDKRPEIRVRAIRALVFLGIFRGRGLLERMLQFEALPVRREAAWALGWLGEAKTSPIALRSTRDYKNEQLRARVVESAARLTGKPLMKNADPHHYEPIEPFDIKRVYKSSGAKSREISTGDSMVRVVEMGSADPLLCFSPLPGSDPGPVLQGLKPLATYRKVVLFHQPAASTQPPRQINAGTREWMMRSASAVLNSVDDYDGEPVDVLGWSLGAAWAASFCLERPDVCRKLVLVSPMTVDPQFWAGASGLLRTSIAPWLASQLDYLETLQDRFHPVAYGYYYERLMAPLYVSDPTRVVPLMQITYPFHVTLPEAPFLRVDDALEVLARGGLPISAVVGQYDVLGTDWRDKLDELSEDETRSVRVYVTPDAAHLALYENPIGAEKFLTRALRRD